MLLLKGKVEKSVILEQLFHNTNSLAVIYYNQPVIDGGLWVNSDTTRFDDFITELSKYLNSIELNIRYDYLIIYTNKGEIPIKNKKDIIKKWEDDFGFTVIVGCK